MSINVSKVILIGRLAADPEIEYTKNGVARTSVQLAVDRPIGETKTDYHNVVAWGKKQGDDGLAGILAEHGYKGQACYVEGRLEYWEPEGGSKRADIRASMIQFLERKPKE